MGWNKSLDDLLQQLSIAKSNTAVYSYDVTGAPSITNEPDTLFYSVFTEEDAYAFYDIFDNYKKYSKENPYLAPNMLKSNLKKQCDAMNARQVSPIEILLFSARLIKDDLQNNDAVKRIVIQAIQGDIPYAPKSIEYILGGWEWPILLDIVIEACGVTNDDRIIQLVMNRSNELIHKYSSSTDHLIIDAYINMIAATQNTEYIPYFATLFAIKEVNENIEVQDFIVNKLMSEPFLKAHTQEIYGAISSQQIPILFRNRLDHTVSGTSSAQRNGQTLNSSLDTSNKINAVQSSEFGQASNDTLKEFESCRDTSVLPSICTKIMNEMDDIKYYQKARAYLLLGTKGKNTNIVTEIENYLEYSMMNNNEFIVPINIALYELGKVDKSSIFESISNSSSTDVWGVAVGRYLKNIQPRIINQDLFTYVDDALAFGDNERTTKALKTLKDMVEIYNGKNKYLSDTAKSKELVDRLFSEINNIIAVTTSEAHFSIIFELLEILVSSCPSKTNAVLKCFDSIIEKIDVNCNLKRRIDSVIRKVDTGREPE